MVGKHNTLPDSSFNAKELEMGIKVEHEHTDDNDIAKAIAKDHLWELYDYYTRLKKMEDDGKLELANAKRRSQQQKEAEDLTDKIEKIIRPDNLKYMCIKEFQDLGYLQELNRRFLQPLGLALTITTGENGDEYTLTGIWDSRHDPEGIIFSEKIANSEQFRLKRERISAEMHKRLKYRKEHLGYGIQIGSDG